MLNQPTGPIAQVFAQQYYTRHNITPPASAALNAAVRPAAIGDPARFAVSTQSHRIDTISVVDS